MIQPRFTIGQRIRMVIQQDILSGEVMAVEVPSDHGQPYYFVRIDDPGKQPNGYWIADNSLPMYVEGDLRFVAMEETWRAAEPQGWARWQALHILADAVITAYRRDDEVPS